MQDLGAGRCRRLSSAFFLREVINFCDAFSPLSQNAPHASVPLPVFRWGNHERAARSRCRGVAPKG